MLQLKNVTKDYVVNSELTVKALKGVSVDFRSNEFVSILGPSGCGKTTLLNIIGGLDQYTSGDLVIDGVSTKDYKDRDWDTYRNHSIGFVFQTYNLIPHQTVLKNVELALTLAGVGKAERRQRAEEALQRVGLGDQLNKRPNQLSGGQMQRVAIARALVNNPTIVLADEPTGALDTETGVQVMEILKEVANDRLVVMVTHNPELAQQYSTRIIRALDGEIVDDSNPLTEEEYAAEKDAEEKLAMAKAQAKAEAKRGKRKVKRSSMSFFTAFKLSLNNLFTKKGRTVLTSFAGSIGIIGIALILSVSQGMSSYIKLVQEQTLTSYPLAIQSTAMDLSQVVATMMGMAEEKPDHGNDKVYNRSTIYNVAKVVADTADAVSENDLKSFKQFLEREIADEKSKLHGAIAGLQYQYDLDLAVYARNVDGKVFGSDVNALLNAVLSKLLDNPEVEMGGYAGSMATFSMNVWQELLSGNDGSLINNLLFDQYDLVEGAWPKKYNEIVLVLNEHNELSDISLYALGLLGDDYVQRIADAFNDEADEYEDVERSWSYEEIFEKEFMVLLASDCYEYNPLTGLWEDQRATQAGLEGLYTTKGIPLKVTGIIKPNPDATATMLNGSIGYTSALTKYVIEQAENSPALKAQLADATTDIFTGLPFANKSDDDLPTEQKASIYREFFAALSGTKKIDEYVEVQVLEYTPVAEGMADSMLAMFGTTDDLRNFILSQLDDSNPSSALIKAYVQSMSDEELHAYAKQQMVDSNLEQYEQKVRGDLQKNYPNEQDRVDYVIGEMEKRTDEQLATYYDETMDVSKSTYEHNLHKLGYVDIETPSVINIYASSFDAKDVIAEEIARYNNEIAEDESQQIRYTDFVAIVMSAVTTIIDAVTYVLIAFVSISLIVSSIMIGVITLISVQERTKEIGILRAIGASKRDVSSMFNAETVIIGFVAGVFGVLFTYLLCIPINLILHALTGIGSLSAYLPPVAALILVLISVALTLISGIIPSRSAAKKDPVTALRTE